LTGTACLPLALPLLVTGIITDDPDNALAFHYLAFNADLFHAGSYFHEALL